MISQALRVTGRVTEDGAGKTKMEKLWRKKEALKAGSAVLKA